VVPASFAYHRPDTIDAAVKLLSGLGDEARVLAGGHSLIPAMKLRLAQPTALVDLGAVRELRAIEERSGRLRIGAMATHADILGSSLVAKRCPLLVQAAYHIGDTQVRNLGTIGGSLAHADPAADWPAVVLALEAEFEVAGPSGPRTIVAADFFVDVLQTSLQPGEILTYINVPATSNAVAYVKTEQKASGFALCGVAAAIDRGTRQVRIGITGVGPVAYRAQAVERTLQGADITAESIANASSLAAEGVTPLSDIHASAEFRTHLATVNTARALRQALKGA
jgi:aerobic carbon-monoxide dehydrogenase medium subunit